MKLHYEREDIEDDSYEQRVIREYWNQQKEESKNPREEEKKSLYFQKEDMEKILERRASRIMHNFVESEKMEPQQKELEIEGVKVVFPCTPYDSQVEYMTRVIRALNNRNYAALESPTGTGKTLCLLAACLAWIYHK